MKKGRVCLVAGLAVALIPPPLVAQDHGGGGGGGGGCGDVFGDLIHILRDEATGQPILQKRWVEMPKELSGYGWGYCTVAVDAAGNELAFAPLSCDVAEEDLARVVEVDYFGRLNGGRTKERNNRMHFNEVLSSIKDAGYVKEGPAGRLTLGYECAENAGGVPLCAEWSTVDSPMESMGLYSRLMKYGHFQTDPRELDLWRAGDPKLPEQYHPALGPEDYAKFHESARHLLPSVSDPWDCFFDANGDGIWNPTEPYTDLETELDPPNGEYDEGEPFMDINANGERDDGGDTFVAACGARESLDDRDFARAGSFAGGAANKFGRSTRDLVQYLNRILKIARKTPHTLATLDRLPARVRVCASTPEEPDPMLEPQVEPTYDMCDCEIIDAHPLLENYDAFPDVQEEFVNFGAAEYERLDWRNEEVEVVRPGAAEGLWEEDKAWLMGWLGYANGPVDAPLTGVAAFVAAMGDTIRSIQFIHNYAIPEQLWDFQSSAPPLPKDKTVK
jgi:hypothetical protein